MAGWIEYAGLSLAIMLLVRCGIAPSADSGDIAKSRTLIAYKISPEMEQAFFSDSQNISPFWKLWGQKQLSYALLTPYLDIKPEVKKEEESQIFKSEFDVQMIAQAAYGDKGIYFLFDVIDDDFPGDSAYSIAWANDNVEIMLDDYSMEQLYENPSLHFPFLKGQQAELTKSNIQIQYSCGGRSPASTVKVSLYDTVNNKPVIEINTFPCKTYTLQKARDSIGIILKCKFLNDMRREQEWFIPWSKAGFRGLGKCPSQGASKALVLNYNDFDTLGATDGLNACKKLTWGGRGNPYGANQKNVWGNLLFGPSVIDHDYSFAVLNNNNAQANSYSLSPLNTGQFKYDNWYYDALVIDKSVSNNIDISLGAFPIWGHFFQNKY
jgi:hypothetical protein